MYTEDNVDRKEVYIYRTAPLSEGLVERTPFFGSASLGVMMNQVYTC